MDSLTIMQSLRDAHSILKQAQVECFRAAGYGADAVTRFVYHAAEHIGKQQEAMLRQEEVSNG